MKGVGWSLAENFLEKIEKGHFFLVKGGVQNLLTPLYMTIMCTFYFNLKRVTGRCVGCYHKKTFEDIIVLLINSIINFTRFNKAVSS